MPILPCSALDCQDAIDSKKHGMCKRHYNAWYYRNVTKVGASTRNALKAVTVPEFTCSHCGLFHPESRSTPKRKQVVRKFCDRKCNADYNNAKTSATKKSARMSAPRFCRTCGTDIRARDIRAKFCTEFCSDVFHGAIPTGPKAELTCSLPGCEEVFVRMKKGHRCCCENHGKILSNRERRADGRDASASGWNERRKANYQKRRAQKLSLPSESVRPVDVYERDEWVCGICSDPVDRNLSYPDPMSPSLDHVIPLSLGGHHVMENLALSHWICNVRKGNRVEADAMSA